MGSFPSDVTFKVNIDPASAIANFKKIEEAFKKGSQGIAGEYEKGAKMAMNMAKQMIDVSNRAGRQLETQLRSIEKQTQSLGKSATEMNETQRKWMLERAKGLKNQEEQEKRINAIYDQRKKFFEEEERRNKAGPNTGNLLFRGARDIFEGRMSYGVMDIGRAVLGTTGGAGAAGAAAGGAGLGGGAALLGIAAGFGAIAIGAFKAAESIGEFGQKIHEVQIVTGMSAKEVQQFDVAAKMTGHDVTEINRMMRGLTQAVTDTSSAGDKGRAGLRALGVDVVGLQLGTVNATEAFLRMGEALKKQPDVFERNSEMMAIFKRAGIEATGTIVELADAIKRTSGTPFLTEAQIQQAKDMHDQIVQMNAQWDYFWNQVKLHAGGVFFTGIQGLKWALPGASQTATGSLAPKLPEPGSPAAGTGMAAISDMLQGRYQAAVVREGGRGLEAAEKIYETLKKAYDSAVADQTLFFRDAEKGTNAWATAVDKSRVAMEKQKTILEEMKRAESDRKTIAEALRRLEIEAAERIAHPYGMLAADQKMKSILEMHGVTDADKARAAAALGPLRLEEVQMLIQRGVNQGGAAAQQVAEALGVEPKPSATQFAQQEQATTAARNRQYLERLKKESQDAQEALKPLLEIQTENRKNEEASALRGVRLGGIMQPQNIETRLAAESQIAQIRERAANQEAEDAKTKLSQEYTTKENYENALTAIRLKNEGEVDKAREDYQAKYLEELRKQTDEIKGKIEPLYQTLFTDPKKFGSQLRSTVRDAALHPIVSGLSEMTSTALRPLIFGATGTGGIAGGFRSMFGGGRLNDVHLINGAVPVHIVGAGGGGFSGGGGGGGWGGGFSGGGGTGGDGGGGFGGGGIGTSLYDLPMMGGGGGAGTNFAGMALAAALGGGGTSGGGGGGRAMNPVAASIQSTLGKYFGGSYAGSGGFSRIGTNIGQYGGAITAPGGPDGASFAARMSALSTGPFAGTKAGPAAGAAGMMLASAGLLGEQRGQVGGAIMGAAGGFLAAGPIGAAIGGAIGIGEMLAGVESPRREAIRLVKSVYHISINNSTADQIVSIANSSYAGHVSLAVRSPEVRHMLGLYAAGTGQGSIFQQSSNDPHGASLVESGGRLQQQATYQYGQAFSQSSNLPIYGNTPTTVLGAPGGGMQLSLNIGGQDAAKFLQGNVVSPDIVQNQYASAMYNSSGRVSQSLMMTEPGSIVS